MRFLILCCMLIAPIAQARDLKYPPKTQRTLWSDSEIGQARENVKRYPQAKKLADSIIKEADYWCEFPDEQLIALITDSRVPRAFVWRERSGFGILRTLVSQGRPPLSSNRTTRIIPNSRDL